MNLWFTEDISIVPGSRLQVKINRTIHSEISDFQKIDVLETALYGRMLLLDDIIMTTEFDEFCYHEMIVHVPLFAHKDPKKVLVIGGGDGGTVREVLKHPGVEEVDLCEIDRRVVEVCEEFMPSLAGDLRKPRVSLNYKDGVQWVKDHKNYYDVIIVDSTDPVGIAENLFKFPFLENCHDSLTEDGILVNQAENYLFHIDIIGKMIEDGKRLFPVQGYYFSTVPTYPGGLIGFTFFSKKYDRMENLEAKLGQPEYRDLIPTFRYWSPEIHQSAFTLPASIQRKIFGTGE